MFSSNSLFGRMIWRGLLAFGCCFFTAFRGAVFAQAPELAPLRTFDLPVDVAEKTLKIFSEQSGRGLIVAAEIALNIRTNAVRGQFTVRGALDRMLAGTGLVAKEDPKTGAFVVHKEPPSPNGQRAGAALRRIRPPTPNNLQSTQNQRNP